MLLLCFIPTRICRRNTLFVGLGRLDQLGVDAGVLVNPTIRAEELHKHFIYIGSTLLIHCTSNAIALILVAGKGAALPVVHDQKDVGAVLPLV